MRRKHSSGVFMMEMIAVIFFFVLCLSVCIKTFVTAELMSREAADLNQSVLIAQSVAEVWKSNGPEGLKKIFQAEHLMDGMEGYAMGFDRKGNLCEKENPVFGVLAEITETGQAKVSVSKNGTHIFSLTVYRHETKY